MAGIAGQQQPPLAPALLDDRMKRIESRALEHGIVRTDPARQHWPEDFWIGEPRGIVARHQHDLPAPAPATDIDHCHRSGGIAELDRVFGQRLHAGTVRVA